MHITKETFNILSLSGGGIKGIFQSTFLKFLEDLYKVPLYQIFDLVAGTSTGSIVGAALSCGISMDEMTSLYMQHGNEIFKKRKVGVKLLRPSWYSNKELKKQLINVFDKKKLSDAYTKLLIPSTSLENYKYSVFTQDGNESIRSLCLLCSCIFILLFIFELRTLDFDKAVDWKSIFLLAILFCITYLYYLGFIKFYRRYTLENLMSILIDQQFEGCVNTQ